MKNLFKLILSLLLIVAFSSCAKKTYTGVVSEVVYDQVYGPMVVFPSAEAGGRKVVIPVTYNDAKNLEDGIGRDTVSYRRSERKIRTW